jgi:hypothetical protein
VKFWRKPVVRLHDAIRYMKATLAPTPRVFPTQLTRLEAVILSAQLGEIYALLIANLCFNVFGHVQLR